MNKLQERMITQQLASLVYNLRNINPSQKTFSMSAIDPYGDLWIFSIRKFDEVENDNDEDDIA